MPGVELKVVVLSRMVRVDLLSTLAEETGERVSYTGKSGQGTENNQRKGPGVGMCWAWSGSSKVAGVAGSEGVRWAVVGGESGRKGTQPRRPAGELCHCL